MAREERLWSPQMRKWAKDSQLHGITLRLETQRWEGGGVTVAVKTRITDDTAVRAVDLSSSDARIVD